MGCGWTGQDSTSMEALFPEHPRHHLCCRQQRPRSCERGPRGTAAYVERGRAQGCFVVGLCQQAGFASTPFILAYQSGSLLTLLQNAMNAAEITDKLGLHSLRQRAWVCKVNSLACDTLANRCHSISNLPAPPLEMVYMKVWNG